MKSTKMQLEARGFVSREELILHKEISDDRLFQLLNSSIPYERTLGAKLSTGRNNEDLLSLLCFLLEHEKMLYTKIALSETIESYGESSLKHLIPLLGKIGNNQHKKISLVDLNKKSYPLPRDISARIIIRIGEPALPYLEEILVSGQYIQKIEAIDAIGHIAFNFRKYQSEDLLHTLLKENIDNELITWKVIRAFQSFSSTKVENHLNYIINNSDNDVFKTEAERSLRQIAKRRESGLI